MALFPVVRRRVALSLLGSAVSLSLAMVSHADTVVKQFAEDTSTFPNPERGFHNRYDLVPGGETNFSRSTNAGNTLVHSYIRLDNYRERDIPQSLLDQLARGLAAAREQGKKVVLRTAYNFGPYPDSEPDANEYWISQHLAQLSPVLQANKDVIAYLEAGFIGAWGEWHTSTNGLDLDMGAKIRIANEMLRYVPAPLHVAMRYPSDARSLINAGVDANRLGSHQDCFLASEPDDWGTWGRDPAYSIDQDKQYIAQLGLNNPVGGETCNVDSPRVTCTTALAEMKMMHFSEINEDFDSAVIDVFKREGCYNEIDQKLGYRFRILSASYSDTAISGASYPLNIQIKNDGFASPYNVRPVFAVLEGEGASYRFPLAANPTQWLSGQEVVINESITLPGDMPQGQYRLSLWLPDSAENLHSDSRYSIRFANLNTWDASSGYNLVASGIEVVEGGPTPSPSPTPSPTITPPNPGGETDYEAEAGSNALTGLARVSACDSCSGGYKVGYVGNNQGSLVYRDIKVNNDGKYSLTVSYISGERRSASMRVNGGIATVIDFDSTGSWSTVGSKSLEVFLSAGTNTIEFANANSWAPDFDRITISGGDTTLPSPTPTPTTSPSPSPTPPPVERIVVDDFDNASQWPGQNDMGVWAGANGFANQSGVIENAALVLAYQSNGWFGTGIAEDVSDKQYLVFAIRGASGGEEQDFRLTLGGVEKTFAEFSGDSITTTNKVIRIDMLANGVNRSSPGQLQMTFWWGGTSTIFVDGIWFE